MAPSAILHQDFPTRDLDLVDGRGRRVVVESRMSEPGFSYEVHKGNGPYMLLVHGMLSGRQQWMHNLERLGEVVRPVVVELWGHGRSPAPRTDEWYGIDACVRQLESLRLKLGAERLFLCGQSFGATLTLRYSVRYAGHVAGQVFTNSISALSEPERFQLNNERRQLIRLLESGRGDVLAGLPIHPTKARRIPPQAREALVAAATDTDPFGIAQLFRITAPQASARSVIPATRVPTLLVNGRWERAFQPFRDLAATLVPGCAIVDVDAGHAVNLEAYEAFNAAVIDFVARIRADAGAYPATGSEEHPGAAQPPPP